MRALRAALRPCSLFGFLALALMTLTAHAGNFFPIEYKQFPSKEGDLLVSARSDGMFAVNKILKVDRIEVPKNTTINIQGKKFVATEDDFLLVVSAANGASEFATFELARAAAVSGAWTVQIGHVPNRAPGASGGQELVGNVPVRESELEGYHRWYKAFRKGEAGIF